MSMLGYVGFVPFLIWTGVRDASIVIAFVAVAIASGLQMLTLIRRDKLTSAPIYLNACINAILIGLICRIVGRSNRVPSGKNTTGSLSSCSPDTRPSSMASTNCACAPAAAPQRSECSPSSG